MSELKARRFWDLDEIIRTDAIVGSLYYLKSEADVVIAEKDKVIAELEAQKAQTEDNCAYWKTMAQKNAADNAVMAKQRAEALKRECHHKYKLCLAMAEMCRARYDEEDAKVNGRGASWDYTSNEMKYWERWSNRWLILSDKFKEAKRWKTQN